MTTTPNIVYVYDIIEQRNIYSNGRIADILGYSQDEIKAMGSEFFAKVLHPHDAEVIADYHAKIAAANENVVVETEYRMQTAQGTYKWLHSNDVVFQRAEDGSVRQILGTAYDITETKARHAAEQNRLSAIIHVQQKLAFAEIDTCSLMDEIVRCVLAVTDADGAIIEQVEGDEFVYKAAAGALGKFAGFRSHVHGTISGECLKSGETIMCNDCQGDPRSTLEAFRSMGIHSLTVIPMRFGDRVCGILKATSSERNAFDTEQAQTLELIAGFAAATLQRASEFAEKHELLDQRSKALEKLRESEETFRLAIESMQEGLMIINASNQILLCNSACETIYGLNRELMDDDRARRQAWRVIREEGWEYAPDEYPGRVVFETGRAVVDMIMGLERSDETTTWIKVSAYPLAYDTQGALQTAVVIASDITRHKLAEQTLNDQVEQINDQKVVLSFQMHELEEANRRLEALATTDGLTGLNNHRSLHEQLDIEVSRAERYSSPLSIIMLDIDNFKQYNDSFGHPAGDALLQMVAKDLKDAARQSDFVGRYGGEEFVIVLPETDRQGAAVIAERLRTRVEEIATGRIAISGSFGVALHQPGMHPGELIEAADRAMYQSKNNGRNCVTVA